MAFVIAIALGGISFSFLSSLAVFLRNARKPKTAYQTWLADVRRQSVVEPR